MDFSKLFQKFIRYYDWDQLCNYEDSFYHIVDANQMLELTALANKIFCSYMQVIRTKKYINAFKEVLKENSISFKFLDLLKRIFLNIEYKNKSPQLRTSLLVE